MSTLDDIVHHSNVHFAGTGTCAWATVRSLRGM